MVEFTGFEASGCKILGEGFSGPTTTEVTSDDTCTKIGPYFSFKLNLVEPCDDDAGDTTVLLFQGEGCSGSPVSHDPSDSNKDECYDESISSAKVFCHEVDVLVENELKAK